jgi:hypothetical protein
MRNSYLRYRSADLAADPEDSPGLLISFLIQCQIAAISLRKYIKASTALHQISEAPTWRTRNASILVGGTFMRYLNSVLALLAATVGIACGAGHANLTSITVSPQSATTTSSPQGQVGYTATGNFANGKSRELSQVDGLSWKTSQTSTGTVAATIGSTGEVTCSAPGTVTITASAPQNLSFTLNNGVHNTSMTVSGSATLTCE